VRGGPGGLRYGAEPTAPHWRRLSRGDASGAPRLVSSVGEPLLWWPALAMICVAAWPGSGVGTVAGIGVALVVLGLVDFGLEHRRHRHQRGTDTQAEVPMTGQLAR
jgi:hypothetical protein